jgi:hypothetical protein
MEIPQSLNGLQPEALDVLRYYGSSGAVAVHAEELMAGAHLSDRGFGKAIRRLVTKNLLVMEGNQTYRLSEAGRRAVAELLEYDLTEPDGAEQLDEELRAAEARFVRRRLIVALPNPLPVNQPAHVAVGFDGASDADIVMLPLHVSLHIEMAHGQAPEDATAGVALENRPVQHVFRVMADAYQRARVRVRVTQEDGTQGETLDCGGMVVEVPVGQGAGEIAAFSADIQLRDTSGDAFDI